MLKNNKNKGFTLVEILLYLGLMTIVISAASVVLTILIQGRLRSQSITEVEQQGTIIIQIITQSIRNADAVNSPTIGMNAASTSLDVYDAGNDPTVFDLASGIIQITEGTGSAVPLNAPNVVVSNLSFENVSRAGTPGTIRIQFDMNYNNTSGISLYDYSKTFSGSASLR